MKTAIPQLIVVAASVGGWQALTRILSQLPAHFPAAMAVVIEPPEPGPASALAALAKQTALRVRMAEDGAELAAGTVHVAPAGHRLTVSGTGRLGVAPAAAQPAPAQPPADALFTSAANALRHRVVGVVLSGTGRDGAAGLTEIHKQGGVCIVQSPGEAQSAQMPMHAILQDDPDYIAFLDDIGPLLMTLATQRRGGAGASP
ncbi:chemotaxis protein CheB [Xenophilus sp. Marseille-Q4582]|uniref:chemotaxis protein CheB n=1 Tax=Xenophilus sp. Marseille-Q4582 TaxID=2866600 RepID=UPI001CE3BA27|nr:chemotaxis protein CheB [Xenophilus sp. Marseille-Q4582]